MRPRNPAAGAGCWPKVDDLLLLLAALTDEPAPAWREWAARNDIEKAHLPPGTFALLPLVSRNLSRLGAHDVMAGKLQGIARRAWYVAQLRLPILAGLLAALREAGIPALLMAGPALAILHYGDLASRAMDDTRLIVPAADVCKALDIARRDGWAEVSARRHRTAAQRAIAPGARIVHGQDLALVLAGRPWDACFDMGVADDVWAAAVPLDIAGERVKAPNAADLLISACLSRRPGEPWLTGAADAVTILRSADGLDWGRVAALSRTLGASRTVGAALACARDALGARVPGDLPEGEAQPVRPASTSLLGRSAELWHAWRALARVPIERRPPGAPSGFPAFVQCVFGLESPGMLPAFAVRAVARRIRRRIRPAR